MKQFLHKLDNNKIAMCNAIAIMIFLLFSINNLFAQDNERNFKLYPMPVLTPTINLQATPTNNPLDERIGNETGGEETQSAMLVPSNDNCSTAFMAANTLSPGANYKCNTTAAGTVEVGEYTGCFVPAPLATSWYSFIADQPTMWICVKPNGASVCSVSFGIAVYKANACFPNSPVACLNYFPATGSNVLSKVNLAGLTVGSLYMVQVAISSAGCAGNMWKPFCIKIGHPSTCTTCANVCGPMCVWAGTPPTVNDITTTCPSYPLSPPMNQFDTQTNCYSFTASNDTVWLQQISYSYCNPNSYSFTWNLYTSGCAPISSGNVFAPPGDRITGLVVGQTYRICYTIQSACSFDSTIWPYAYTTSSSLPVELVSFGGMSLNEKIKLYWTTASEENCKEYIIEKTRNAMDFAEVTHVKAAGNSTSLLNYKAYDTAPLHGKNFYRIKQIDYNGDFTYSKLIAVNYAELSSGISIIPNPATDMTSIEFNSAGDYPVLLKLIDMQGKIIINKHFASTEGSNEFVLDTRQVAKGIYSLQLLYDDQNIVTKFVKE
jgi:hypothetical protein